MAKTQLPPPGRAAVRHAASQAGQHSLVIAAQHPSLPIWAHLGHDDDCAEAWPGRTTKSSAAVAARRSRKDD